MVYNYTLRLLSSLTHTPFTLERHDRSVKKTFWLWQTFIFQIKFSSIIAFGNRTGITWDGLDGLVKYEKCEYQKGFKMILILQIQVDD